MRTVVLAGGFGTRLQPILKYLPKPLAPIGNKCFLEYLLDNLKISGLNDFVFCLHYMADKIIKLFGNGEKYGVRISYSVEERPMGTAGAVGLLRNCMDGAFCVINADTYLELDIRDLIGSYKNSGAAAAMAVTRVEDPARYGSIVLDQKGFIKGFTEKGENFLTDGFINAGLYIFEPEIFDYIPGNRSVSLEKEVFPMLLQDKKQIYAYSKVTNFFDIGVPEDYYSFRKWASAKGEKEYGS